MREAINCNQRAIKEKGQSNPIGKQAQGLRRDVHTAACRSHLLLALRDEVSSVLELLLQYTLVPVGKRGGVRAVMSSCTHWVHEHRPTYT